MSNKIIINFILAALMISYGAVGYFLLKEEKKHFKKQPTFYKKEYKFPKPKDWNTKNLTGDQRRFYEHLNSAE